ncbi:MAG: HNH endonuclease [Chromatiaceae bacterium]|nr:HNH endonuclease [Chromatiaceae bacterium]
MVEDFLEELFSLAESRQKADTLDPRRPPTREGFPEGKLKERLHRSRERNPEIIRRAKQIALTRDGVLRCACCGFDFEKVYGKPGKDFIEGHHTKPLSSLHIDGELTRVDDIALVCSNCHRMLHRRRPWLGPKQLTQLLQ